MAKKTKTPQPERVLGPITLGQFRALTYHLPAESRVVLRFLDPAGVQDHEPGVMLEGLAIDGTNSSDVELLVSLFGLNDAEPGDDLCDLCHNSNVNVDRTTYCGKTIGSECGCDEDHADGCCDEPGCVQCYAHRDGIADE